MARRKWLLSTTAVCVLAAAILALRPGDIDRRPVASHEQASAESQAVQSKRVPPPDSSRAGVEAMATSASKSKPPGAAAAASGFSVEDPDRAFIRGRLTERYGSLEAGFLMRVAAAAEDWEAVKATVLEHEALTGNDYRALLMKVGINTRVIPADELVRLLDEGVMPPPNVAEQLVASSDSGLVSVFAERGLVPDLNAPNRSSGRDALGTLALNVSYAPARYDKQAIRNHVETFVALGALPDQALLEVLKAPNRSNVEHLIWLARALVDNGATLGPEHVALIHSIRMADVHRRFAEEFLEAGSP